MSAPGRLGKWVSALVALLVAIACGLANAPATWLDALASAATSVRFRLAEAQGTIWRGSGRIVWADIGDTAETRLSLSGVALPGRVIWQLSPAAMLIGLVEASLQIDGMAQPVAVQGSFSNWRVANGRLELPRFELSSLGSPWNTIRPAGALALSWNNVVLERGRFEGSVMIELRSVASALSTVRPLGSYRIEIRGESGVAQVAITTIEGALLLTGNGSVGARGLGFVARARPAEAGDERLRSLLGLMGSREGDATIIRIGS